MKYKVIAQVVYEQEFIVDDEPFPPMPELGTWLTEEHMADKQKAKKIARSILSQIDLEDRKPKKSTLEDFLSMEVISLKTGETVYIDEEM